MADANNLLNRYTPSQREVISSFFTKLSVNVNKTGKMLESKKIRILQSWERYPAEIVIDALNVYLKMEIAQSQRGKGKNEKYVLGIMRNKEAEINAGSVVCGHGTADREDEGARLGALIGEREPTDAELDCDF